jgi:glycosyltransferase involved in cell wall biosynthesis
MFNDYEISIVSPVYNEAEGVEEFYRRVSQILSEKHIAYEMIFVDDGSQDQSFEILKRFRQQDPSRVKILRLARNFGHQMAITAGLRMAKGKAVIVMDSDLQDPPEVILRFIEKRREGYDVVYGVRTERKGETFFKKATASLFYKFIRKATNIDIPANVGDFYLLDRKVVDVLNQMDERHRFIRGMVAWAGFKRLGVGYVREARFAGKTKYGFWKMVKFSFDAATAFSFMPLRAISLFGFIISGLSAIGILLILYVRFFTNLTITGWSSLMVVVLFIGGIQLLSIGLIGEYVARIGDDVKHRPLYTVEEIIE